MTVIRQRRRGLRADREIVECALVERVRLRVGPMKSTGMNHLHGTPARDQGWPKVNLHHR